MSSKDAGMAAVAIGGIMYLVNIGKRNVDAQRIVASGLKEISAEKVKEIFPELGDVDVKIADTYRIDVANKVLFIPEKPKKIFVAHEAGHMAIHNRRNNGIKRLLGKIQYILYPVSEEKEAWEYAKKYASRSENVDRIKKPFIGSYKIAIAKQLFVSILSAAVAVFALDKLTRDDRDEG